MYRRFSFERCCSLLLGLLALTASAGPPSREYQIKAAFLLNFAQFVQWPDTSFTSPGAPLCVGVLGEDPFGGVLEETVRGESIHDHKLAVRGAAKVEDLAGCQLVFVSKSEGKRVAEILARMDSLPVMTVSEVSGFAKQGGTINFYKEQNKVRFEINPGAARQRGLKINSQLLGLGKIVESPPVNK
jgi:hypothetical protein